MLKMQQLNRLDNDRVREEIPPENRLLENCVEFCVALHECAGKTVPRSIEELAGQARRKSSSGASGCRGGEKLTATCIHRHAPLNRYIGHLNYEDAAILVRMGGVHHGLGCCVKISCCVSPVALRFVIHISAYSRQRATPSASALVAV